MPGALTEGRVDGVLLGHPTTRLWTVGPNQVSIGSIMTSHTVTDYDTPWFVSVARAVAKVQPAMVVHNLPEGYDGPLRRPHD